MTSQINAQLALVFIDAMRVSLAGSRTRRGLLSATLAVLAFGGLTVPNAWGHAADRGGNPSLGPATVLRAPSAFSAKAKQPNQAAIAKRLATRYGKARTEQARYRALVAIARKLRVGVYTPRGRAVVRMRARKRLDPEFYDFELRLLASHPNERSSLDDVVGTVNRATGSGTPLTAGRLAGALASGTQRARRRPRNRFSLPALLIRELGLRQQPRTDSARRTGARAMQLSRVQRWLLLTEIVTGQARAMAGRPRAKQAQIDLPPGRSDEPPGNRDELEDVCGVSARGRQWSAFGQTLGGVVSDTVNSIQVLISNFHGSMLEDVIVVTSDSYGRNGHYGHAPGSGSQFTFIISVAARYSESAKEVERRVKCGPLVGVQMPAPGRIPDVPIDWEKSGFATLLEHGEVTHRDKVTGADGSARLSVRLQDEAIPGIGEERQVDGTLAPAVNVRSMFSPLTGFIQELVIAPDVEFPFSIKWHEPKGLKFSAHVEGTRDPFGVWTTFDYTATACDAVEIHNTEFTGYWRFTYNNTSAMDRAMYHKGPLRVIFTESGAGLWRRAGWSLAPLSVEGPNPTGEETETEDPWHAGEPIFPLDWSTWDAPSTNTWFGGPGDDSLEMAVAQNEQNKWVVKIWEDEYGSPYVLEAPFLKRHLAQVEITEPDAGKCNP